MTDREKIKVLSDALELLAGSSMGEPSLWAKEYESQVKQMAREALLQISDTTPQD